MAGVFGMAGGMILMGVLLLLVSVPDAMILHGITQMTSNGWRAWLWRNRIKWLIVARYSLGLIVAGGVFSALRFVPDERLVFIFLGIVPFIAFIIPVKYTLQADKRLGAELCGFLCTVLQFLSGVSGPTLDLFFVRSQMDRRTVVATKATCQVLTHLAKLFYFGAVVGGATQLALDPFVIFAAVAFAIFGTSLSRRVLESLTDISFRTYTRWLVMLIGLVYLWQGLVGFM